jgi:quercetin dioxygenase-like cupin family protein
MERPTARKTETEAVEGPPGIMRTTIAYNDQLMLCHFHLKKGITIPFHAHDAAQNGFLIKGRLRIKWQSGKEFLAGPGDGWCFASNESHGAEAIEESEAIECFTPIRTDYIPAKR